MSNSKTVSKSGGIGFLGMLTILFIGLKLTGSIDWSWWYVLMPIYAPIAIILAVLGIAGIVALVIAAFDK